MSTRFRKLPLDTNAVAGGDLITSASGIKDAHILPASESLTILKIKIFGKPASGTMKPKLRIWEKAVEKDVFCKGLLIDNIPTISDTTNGEPYALVPIVVGYDEIAVVLEACETGGQLWYQIERTAA